MRDVEGSVNAFEFQLIKSVRLHDVMQLRSVQLLLEASSIFEAFHHDLVMAWISDANNVPRLFHPLARKRVTTKPRVAYSYAFNGNSNKTSRAKSISTAPRISTSVG